MNEDIRKRRRRSKLEARADILRAIRDGPCGKEIQTHVMYKANLSWIVMRRYLSELQSWNMVSETSKLRQVKGNPIDGPDVPMGHRVLALTDRGRMWLESYELLLKNQCSPRESVLIQ